MRVRMINVNHGHNQKLMEACHPLTEYAWVVDRIRTLGKKKGLDVFSDLVARLDPEKYQIVLVGTDDTIDGSLPASVISIHRTHDQKELAEIYTAADVFVNPTREEVLGLVNIEALACGTPVVTFDTGGSPECIDESCGVIVDPDNIDGLVSAIKTVCEDKRYSQEDCINRSKNFNRSQKYQEYVDLYQATEDC